MKTNIKPLRDYILVKPEKEKKEKTETGIYLPGDQKEDKPQIGKILAVGDSEKIKLKNNQRVVFKKFSGAEVELDGEEYLLLKNEDILAVFE